jgi:hypothetical protein
MNFLSKSFNLFKHSSKRAYRSTSSFNHKNIAIIPREELLPKPPKDHQYTFGGLSTDYLLDIDYDRQNGGW